MGRILRWGSLQLCQSLVNGLYIPVPLLFLVGSSISDFIQKWLLGNIKYFASFKLKSLKSNEFQTEYYSIQRLTTYL